MTFDISGKFHKGLLHGMEFLNFGQVIALSTLLLTPSWLKVGGEKEQLAMWWVVHVIIVSAPVQNIGFLDFSDLVWTQGQD